MKTIIIHIKEAIAFGPIYLLKKIYEQITKTKENKTNS
jgi:hypothetical protein